MAQTLVTIGAAYVDYQVFGGLPVASTALAAYRADNTQIEGAKLTDLTLPRVDYGQPLARVWGRYRTSGQVLWLSALREIATTTEQGKGGGPDVTTYTYECDALFEVAHNEIDAVSRIWSNGELKFTALVGSSNASLGASLSQAANWDEVIVYTGSPSQSPDPTYEAAFGVGNVPAYRHRGTVMIKGLKLGASKQIPLLTFEVLTNATNATQYVEIAQQPPHGAEVVSDMIDVLGNPVRFETQGVGAFRISSVPYGTLGPLGGVKTSTDVPAIGRRYFEVSNDLTGYSSATNTWIDVRVGSNAVGSNHAGGYTTGIGVGSTVDIPAEGFGRIPFGSGPFPRVVMYAFDFDAGRYWVGLDGVWATNTGGSLNTGNPATGVGGRPMSLGSGVARIHYSIGDATVSHVFAIRTAGDQFSYAPPSGFIPWSSDGDYADVWTPQPVYLDDVCVDLCTLAGLDASQVDASALSAIEVTGVPVTAVAPVRSTLEALAAAYYFEAFEANKIYFVARGGSSAATITADDCCAGEGAATDDDPVAVERGNDLEVPARWSVSFYNLDDDYQAGSVYSDRQIGVSDETRAITVPVVLSPSRAQGLAETLALDSRVAATSLRVSIDDSRPQLSPTDVVTLVDEEGISYRARIGRETFDGGSHALECVLDDASVLLTSGTTATYTPSIVVNPISPTEYLIADCPLLRDEDDAPGLYVAVKTNDSSWPGATVFITRDLVNYTQVGTLSSRAVGGIATTALGNWTGGNAWDEANTVTVDVGAGTLSSYSREDIIAGTADGYLLAAGTDDWELLYARTATLLSSGPNVYRLSGLLRGRKGTEWATGLHAIGDSVLLLRATGILNVPLQQSDLAQEIGIKVVTNGRSLAGTQGALVNPQFVRLKPYAASDLRVARDSSNNATITCKRRGRLSHRLFSSAGNPALGNGETPEFYVVQVYSTSGFSTLVRTFNVNGTGGGLSQPYSASEQTSDGLTPGNPLHIRIYQVSSRVGSGYVLQGSA